jgi:hypothetical protein
MPGLLAAVRNAVAAVVANAQVNQQIQCGILRSGSTILPNAFPGTSSQSVAIIYVQNSTGGADPQLIRSHIIAMITSNPNPINVNLLQSGFSEQATNNYDSYKTCTNGQVKSNDLLCDGEPGSNSGGSSGLSSGAIAGIVIGVIIGVAILVVLAFFIIRNRGDKHQTLHEEDAITHTDEHYETEHSEARNDDDGGVELQTTNVNAVDDYSEGEVQTNDESDELV